MNEEIEEALWDGVLTKNSLLHAAGEYASERDYQNSAIHESMARGARLAMVAVLNALNEKPEGIMETLEQWDA